MTELSLVPARTALVVIDLQYGITQYFVEDATASMSAAMHRFAMTSIFPRLGRIRSTPEVMAAIEQVTTPS